MTEASASVSLLLAATLDTLVSDVLSLISSDQMTRNKTLRKSVARKKTYFSSRGIMSLSVPLRLKFDPEKKTMRR